MEILAQTRTSAAVIALAKTSLPQVALVDVRLQDENGIELSHELKSQYSALRVLMFTSYSDRHMAGQQCGVSPMLRSDRSNRRALSRKPR